MSKITQCIIDKANAARYDYAQYLEPGQTLNDFIENMKSSYVAGENPAEAASQALESHILDLEKKHRLALWSLKVAAEKKNILRQSLDAAKSSTKQRKILADNLTGFGDKYDSQQVSVPNQIKAMQLHLYNQMVHYVTNGSDEFSDVRAYLKSPEKQLEIFEIAHGENFGLNPEGQKMFDRLQKFQKYMYESLKQEGYQLEELPNRLFSQGYSFERFLNDPTLTQLFRDDASISTTELKDQFVNDMLDRIDFEKTYQRPKMNMLASVTEARNQSEEDQILKDNTKKILTGKSSKKPTYDGFTKEEKIKALEKLYQDSIMRQAGTIKNITDNTTQDVGDAVMNAHRQVFYKTAQDAYEMMVKYGHNNLWQAMESDIRSTAKKLGMAKVFGPNPRESLQLTINALKKMEGNNLNPEDTIRLNKDLENYVDVMQGHTNGYSNLSEKYFDHLSKAAVTIVKSGGWLAYALPQDLMNIVTHFKYLGVDGKTSVVTIGKSLKTTALHYIDPLLNKIGLDTSKWDIESKAYMNALYKGYKAAELASNEDGTVFNINSKFGNGNVAAWQDKVLKFGGIVSHDYGVKSSTQLSLSRYIGEFANTEFDALPDDLRQWMSRYGLNKKHWDVWRSQVVKDGVLEGCMLPQVLVSKDISLKDATDLYARTYAMLSDPYNAIVPTGKPKSLKYLNISGIPKILLDQFLSLKGYGLNMTKMYTRITSKYSSTTKYLHLGKAIAFTGAASYLSYAIGQVLNNKPIDTSVESWMENGFMHTGGYFLDLIQDYARSPVQATARLAGPLVQEGTMVAETIDKLYHIGKLKKEGKHERANSENALLVMSDFANNVNGFTKSVMGMALGAIGLRKAWDDMCQPGYYERKQRAELRKQEKNND